jgi:hypothetical protein
MWIFARAWQAHLLAASLFALLAAGCGGTGGGSNDWYYHWTCNGDSQCQALAVVPLPHRQSLDSLPRVARPARTSPSREQASSTSQVTVTIDGLLGLVAVSTSTQIIVTIPLMGTFKGPLHVTTPNGTAVSSGSFSVINPLNGVTWSATNSLFVAVGADGTILTSPDGITWTPQASGVDLAKQSNLHGVTCSATKCITVGDNGYTIVSTDGVTWTIPPGSGIYGITSSKVSPGPERRLQESGRRPPFRPPLMA